MNRFVLVCLWVLLGHPKPSFAENNISSDLIPSGLELVCSSIRELKPCEIWKSEASDSIPSSDPRSQSTSFITLRGCAGLYPSCISVYDRDGNLVHKIGEYLDATTSYDSRHYGGTGCGDRSLPATISLLAKTNTGSTEVYIKDTSGACSRITDPINCYNSSYC